MATSNAINAFKVAILTAVATALTNVETAFSNLAANPTEANAVEQLAVIEGQLATLELEAPAMVPGLESAAIAEGAQEAKQGLSNIIASINAAIAGSSTSGSSAGKSSA